MELPIMYIVWLCVGVAGIAIPLSIVAAGWWIQRIGWADRAVLAGLALAAVSTFALFVLDAGWLARFGYSPRGGLRFGLSWVSSIVFILLPVAFVVGRKREVRGWTRSIAGVADKGRSADGGRSDDSQR